eukprot:9940953-Lingulodinium_polyedra.AAC.1
MCIRDRTNGKPLTTPRSTTLGRPSANWGAPVDRGACCLGLPNAAPAQNRGGTGRRLETASGTLPGRAPA